MKRTTVVNFMALVLMVLLSEAGQGSEPVVIDASEYPSLQAALDAVPEGGALVKLPPGDFELTEPLILTRGKTQVEGCGAATCLINLNQEGKPALIVQPPNFEKNSSATIWRVKLADFRIQGTPNAVNNKFKKPAPKSGDGVLARNVEEIYIHGLCIDHCGGHGLNMINCKEDARIAASIFTYNAKAGVNIVGGHDVIVNANQFEENQDALRYIDGYNLCMNGNNLDDHLRHGVVIENTYGSVLSGNMIEECQDTGIVLDRDCYGITISANVLADNFTTGIDLRDAWGCAVSANAFTVNWKRGLLIRAGSGRITVTGNNFSDTNVGRKRIRHGKNNQAVGVVLEGTSDIVVTGNLFSGLIGHAVKADANCRRIMLDGNLTVDLNPESDEKLPSFKLGGAKDTVLGDNALHDAMPK